MNKLLAVLKREYLMIVRKKMFIVMTFLLPALMAGAMLIPTLIAAKGLGEKRVAVVDGTGGLRDAFVKKAEEKSAKPADAEKIDSDDIGGRVAVEYLPTSGDPEAAAKPYLDRLTTTDKTKRLDGVLIIPTEALTSSDKTMKYYSRSATDFIAQTTLSQQANRAIQRHRLGTRGLAADEIEKLLKRVPVDAVQLSKSGEQKKGGVANFFIGFVLTALVILPAFIYGMEIMRGIIQEKTDRVVEVLISSMSPRELLVGKIAGVALVGLTQVAVWFLMAAGIGAYMIYIAQATMGANIVQLLRPATFLYFLLFFILAYSTYVCIYAIAGACCNSEKEAQQMIAPITLVMMVPWFLLFAIITNPDSALTVGLSLAPVFGPVTMYVRTLVAEPPVWHILVSVAVSLCTIAVFFWATAKIFRIGILSYGKRPTMAELWRWMKVA